VRQFLYKLQNTDTNISQLSVKRILGNCVAFISILCSKLANT